uniref:Uncharacterized protein n=1 Tax=Medicago truncatula TaxID=3880 RepID=I3SD14_MEDTR|nr:unknown [Medicago truncatula]
MFCLLRSSLLRYKTVVKPEPGPKLPFSSTTWLSSLVLDLRLQRY